MLSQKELVEQAIEALENIDPNDPASADLATYLYIADRRLSDYIDQLKEFTQLENPTLSESKKGGELLEQIAFLVFQGLEGATGLKSFQSAGPQYDLLVSGDQLAWLYVCKLLYLKENQISFQRHIAYILANSESVEPAYLSMWLNSPQGRKYADQVALGNAQKTVTLGELASFPVLLPEIEEQRRITEILDTHETRIRQEEAYREKLKLQKQGLMHDLLTGKVRVKI